MTTVFISSKNRNSIYILFRPLPIGHIAPFAATCSDAPTGTKAEAIESQEPLPEKWGNRVKNKISTNSTEAK